MLKRELTSIRRENPQGETDLWWWICFSKDYVPDDHNDWLVELAGLAQFIEESL